MPISFSPAGTTAVKTTILSSPVEKTSVVSRCFSVGRIVMLMKPQVRWPSSFGIFLYFSHTSLAANGFGVVGVAPDAFLYGLKVLSASGSGSFSDIIAALQWAVECPPCQAVGVGQGD